MPDSPNLQNDTDEQKTGFWKEFTLTLKNAFSQTIIVRLLTAWFAMGVIQRLFSGSLLFTDVEFFKNYGLLKCLAVFLLCFAAACLPVLKKYLKYILFFCAFLFFAFTLPQRSDFGFYMGAALIMTLVSSYAFSSSAFSRDIKPWICCAVSIAVSLFTVAFVGIVTVLNYKACWTPNYDFGIFSQMFHYLKETFTPLTTCERDRLLSHFAVHFSPVYYLLLPAYALFPTPETLLVSQGIIVVSGVIPLLLLARKLGHSYLTSALLGVSYLIMPATVGGNLYYLHENVFLAPFLLWLFYFTECKKYLPASAAALLVMLVKEDAPMYVAFFGIYLIISGKDRRFGAAVTAAAVVYFAAVIGCMEKFGEGVMFGRYENFNKDGEPVSMIGVIITAFRNPAYLISECFQNDKITFIFQLLLPVLFIPLMTRKFSRFILLGPAIVVNLMSDYAYQHDINFQYVFGSAAFIIYLTAVNSADFPKGRRERVLIPAAVSAALAFSSMYFSRFGIIETYRANMEEHETIAQSLELIPDDASVAASTFLVANLSDRDILYDLDYTKQTADYYVLDLRYKSEKYSVGYFLANGYEQVTVNDYVAVFRRTEQTKK